MSDKNQTPPAGSGQQNQDAGQSGQQAPAEMSEKAKEGLLNLLGSFAAAGFTATVVDPKKEDKTAPTTGG